MTEPTQEELDSLPVEKRVELLEAQRQFDEQARERRRQNRHQWFNSVGVLFGVLFTAAGLVVTTLTWRAGQEELRSARETQITDRYAKAVEQLASSTADVRLGAIYALHRIATDSAKDRKTIREILAAFVRNHDFCSTRPPARQCTAPMAELTFVRTVKRLPPDVRAALSTALSLTESGDEPLDLSQTRFPRVTLPPVHLSRANLQGADLTWANLSGSDLSLANAQGACLANADLTDANLSKANLRGADLYEASLDGANLTGADLRWADLRGLHGVTPEDIKSVAVTNAQTLFGENRTSQQGCGPDSTLTENPLHPG